MGRLSLDVRTKERCKTGRPKETSARRQPTPVDETQAERGVECALELGV